MKYHILKAGCLISLTTVFSCLNATATASTKVEDLVSVYNTALNNNASFKDAVYTYQAAKEDLPIAYSALLPQVSLSYSYGASLDNSPSSNSQDSSTTISANQTIFSWSAFQNIMSAQESIESAYATYISAKQQLIANTIGAYLDILEKQKIFSIDEHYYQMLKQAKTSNQSTTKSSDKALNNSSSDATQLASNVEQQALQVIKDKQSLTQSIESLRTLTNSYYYLLLGPKSLAQVKPLSPSTVNDWVDITKKNNLNIIAAEASLRAAKTTLSTQRGVYIPTVSFQSSYASSQDMAANIPTSTSDSTQLTLSVSMPLFSGGSNIATMKQDKYDVLAAQESVDDAIQSAISSTKTDYVAVQSALQSFNASISAANAAKHAFEDATKQYQNKEINIYDYISSISTYVAAKKSIAQNLIAYFNAVVALHLQAGIISDKDIGSLNKIFNQQVNVQKVNYN